MLAKQGWRILQSPSSLVGKVYKAKYFPHTSFIETQLGSQPSYVWRSVLQGREIINRGAFWRVSKGTEIRVYQDRWIPRQKTMKIYSPPSLGRDTLVCDLINHNHNWDEEKIRSHFLPDDAEMILALPLSNNGGEDTLTWYHTKDGAYSVKSGYWLARELLEGENADATEACQSSQPMTSWWSKIWNLHVPPKIKIFIWRASTRSLPTATRLASRNVAVQLVCKQCNKAEETIEHVLMGCKRALDIWAMVGLKHLLSLRRGTFSDWASEITFSQQKDICEAFVTTAWAIWNARNSYVFRDKMIPAEILSASVKDILRRFHDANPPSSKKILPREKQKLQWIPPEHGVYKINVDRACDTSRRVAGLGVVVRNWDGDFIAGFAQRLPGWSFPVTTEALAILNGLKLVCDLNLNSWIVESDAQMVVNAINKEGDDFSIIGNIVKECKSILTENPQGKCVFVSRSRNTAAHMFAKFALNIDDKVSWKDVCPVWAVEYLCNNVQVSINDE